MKIKIYPFLGVLVLLIIWQLLTLFAVISPILLPSPIKVFSVIGNLFWSGVIFKDLYRSLFIWFSGFFLGLFVGVPAGILMGYSNRVYESLELIIDFFRSLPSLVLYPLFVVFFGLGTIPKILLVIFVSSFYTLINTIYGVKYSRETYPIIAKIFKATKTQLFTKIILPAALPDIFAGIRISLSIALIVTVGSEMILGSDAGLGKRILDCSMVYNMSEMYAVIIIIGLLGWLSNKMAVLAEEKIVHWRGK
jgi:NitT/TauT family transport system permease protein